MKIKTLRVHITLVEELKKKNLSLSCQIL